MNKLALAILLVPSVALAQPSDPVPAPAPLPVMVPNLPSSPIVALPASGYVVLPVAPEAPSHARHIAGGITLAAGIGLAVLGGLLLANRPDVPALSAPGWYDASTRNGEETVGGAMLIGTGLVTAAVGAYVLAAPDQPYGEIPGSPILTF